MIRVEIEQGTQAWHEWRAKGVGASEAPMVFGASPYMTQLELYRLKMGITKPIPPHPGMIRGIRLEPIAREWYMKKTGILVRPQCVQHDQIPYLRASLDGLDVFGMGFCEIKCPNQKDHQLALSGRVPFHYWVQMQYQMLVTGLKKGHYVSFDGENGVILDVVADIAFQATLMTRVSYFWDCVELSVEPKVVAWDEAAARYMLTLYEKESLEAGLKRQQEELGRLIPAGAKFHQGAGIKATLVGSKVSVNWLKAAEAALGEEIDMERAARFLAKEWGGKEIDAPHIEKASKSSAGYILVTPEKGYLPPSDAVSATPFMNPMAQIPVSNGSEGVGMDFSW